MLNFFPTRTIALQLGGYAVHWYGVLYVLAFLIGFLLLPRLQKRCGLVLSTDDQLFIVVAAMLGVIVGGRLGYVLFYEPSYFVQHPGEIFQIWRGGMSSHGGFIGVAAALYVISRLLKVRFWQLTDLVVVPVAIGLALGRLGNFINQELHGTITNLPWGMSFPGVPGRRHPVQLYAAAKDVLIAAVCFLWLQKQRPYRPGEVTSLFLLLYGALRFLLEFVRAQEYPPISFGAVILTRGQFLTLPLLLIGAWLWFASRQSTTALATEGPSAS